MIKLTLEELLQLPDNTKIVVTVGYLKECANKERNKFLTDIKKIREQTSSKVILDN